MEKNNHEHTHTHSEQKHSHTHEHDEQSGHEHDHVHPAEKHTHKHAHGEGKVDQHTHDHTNETGKDESSMLNILLDHWVNHNEDHAQDFSEWSKKATTMGKPETAKAIMDAVDYIKKANEFLVIAKEKMK